MEYLSTVLYIHVSSAVQNAPAVKPQVASQYGAGMSAPLMSQGPSVPVATQPAVKVPPVQKEEYVLPKMTSQSTSMGGGSFGGAGSGMDVSGYNL